MNGGPVDSLSEHVRALRLPEPVFVTKTTLPPLEKVLPALEELWETRWITNDGAFHKAFGAALRDYLNVEHLSLVCNATLGLYLGLKALGLREGEVITTPFTFVATPHSILLSRLTPVFADVDPVTLTLDPERVEAAITPRTVGILPVHVYGRPCDLAAYEDIAQRHGLPILYDAAHAFGVHDGQRSLLQAGDLSVVSFHASKPFSVGEGGVVVARNDHLRERIDELKNFGIKDYETLGPPGLNAKLAEIPCAIGLQQLPAYAEEVQARAAIDACYRRLLTDVPGLTLPPELSAPWRSNHAYFPVRITADYGLSRDELHATLERFNIRTRKYFFPLCTWFDPYKPMASAQPENIPVAERAAREILCLPIYGSLPLETAERIAEVITLLPTVRGAVGS